MRATVSVLTDPAMLTSSTAVEPTAFSAWSSGTTYSFGQIVSVVADFANYESLQNSNTNHTPNSSPLWWRKIGYTEAAYNAATTYAAGDVVYSTTTHRCYQSLQAGNIGHALPVLPETATSWWTDLGPTNKYACLDLDRNTQTVYSSPMTITVAPGQRINTIGLTGLVANTLTISATSVTGGGTVYPLPFDATKTYAKNECVTVGLSTCYQSKADGNVGHTPPDATWWTAVSGYVFDLNTRIVNDGYDYAFEPFSTRPSKVVFDIPPFSDIVVSITLAANSGNVKLGSLVAGTFIYLGDFQYDAENDGLNFSTITRDLYGTATLVKRRSVPKLTGVATLPSYRVNKALAARATLNATPALWNGIDDDSSDWFDMLTILGVYKQFKGKAWLPEKAQFYLEVEEI